MPARLAVRNNNRQRLAYGPRPDEDQDHIYGLFIVGLRQHQPLYFRVVVVFFLQIVAMIEETIGFRRALVALEGLIKLAWFETHPNGLAVPGRLTCISASR